MISPAAVSEDRDENGTEDCLMGHWNVKSQGKEEKSIKEMEEEGPVKYESNQWCAGKYNNQFTKKNNS